MVISVKFPEGMSAPKSVSHSDTVRVHNHKYWNDRLLPTILFLAPLLTCVAPRLAPYFVAILSFSLIWSTLSRGGQWKELLPWRLALAVSILFGAYTLLSATWSADVPAGIAKGSLLIGLILLSFSAVNAAARLEPEASRRAALAFAGGAFLGAIFIAFELCTDGLATRTAMQWIPLLKRSPKHVKISQDLTIRALRLSKLDQNVNLALFHLWPALLALMTLNRARRWLVMPLFFLATATTIAISNHDSSQVALIGSTIIVLLAWYWPRHVVRALAGLWCAAFLIVIPASLTAYQNGLQFAEWLPDSARARVILWQFTAEQIMAQPVLGVGVDSTPTLSQQQKATLGREKPEGFIFPRTMGHHAHNIYLQTWYELGAVGVLFFAAAGAAVAVLIFLLPPSAQPFAAGSFRCLCLGRCLRLGHVAVLVHVRRGVAADLLAGGGGTKK